MNNLKTQKIITHDLNVISTDSLLQEFEKFSLSDKSNYICITPVHAIIEAYNNKAFSEVVNNADLALPDGRPVYWALKLLKHKEAGYFPGHLVTRLICKLASENKLKVGFYGGKIETLNKCVNKLKSEFKNLDIGYVYSPPFRDLEDNQKNLIIKDINESKIQFLFVCLGCPKQEFWMAEHKETIECTKVGIGAAIEFIAGTSYVPPVWIQKFGLWWLIRLILEPRRLFWRYFNTNFKFIYLFFKQYIKR